MTRRPLGPTTYFFLLFLITNPYILIALITNPYIGSSSEENAATARRPYTNSSPSPSTSTPSTSTPSTFTLPRRLPLDRANSSDPASDLHPHHIERLQRSTCASISEYITVTMVKRAASAAHSMPTFPNFTSISKLHTLNI